MFQERLWTMGLKRLMLSFGPGFSTQRVFIAILINNNISHQILRFYVLKALDTTNEEISKLPYSNRSYLLLTE
jgi:hypothetical protein